MSLPSFSVRNPVLVNMMMVVILVAGALFAATLVREMFPETRPDKIGISAIYPGVQPQEIERAVTIKIEEAVHDIEGVEKVDSMVAEGFSFTTLTLFSDVSDIDAVLQEVKTEVDAIEDLPDDLEKLTVKKLEPKLPVIMVAVFGPGPEAERKQAARALRDALLLLPGISDVEMAGQREDEISIEVRPERLLEYDVTFQEVAEAIRQSNLDVSGGQLKGERTRVAVRTLGEQLRGVDLEGIVVRSRPDGRNIRLSDLAVVRDEFVETDVASYFNGQPAIDCVVYKTSAQDAIQIATLVKAFVAGKQGVPFDPYGIAAAFEQPWYWRPLALAGAYFSRGLDGVICRMAGRPTPLEVYEQSRRSPFDHNFQVALHTDLARFVEGRLELMTRNGRSGLILVLISLNLFLNWRVAFWAAVGLPVSFLGTFIVMWALGSTINLLTLFGLIIVLGIIVDDAIVIGENIYRHVEEGVPPLRAAVQGAEEVMWPVIIAVATTIAAFAPLLFIQGRIGDFMGQLPIVVLAALSVSLLEALIILPAHLRHLPSRLQQHRPRRLEPVGWLAAAIQQFRGLQDRFYHGALARTYERFLRFTLRWRYATVATALGLLLVSMGLLAGGIVEWVFIQKMDSETLICAVDMPVGTPAERLKERMQQISDFAMQMPEVASVQMHVARQVDFNQAGTAPANDQSHLGQMVIELFPADVRERKGQRSSTMLLGELRSLTERLAGVNAVTWDEMSGGPGGKAIHVRITGAAFPELLEVSEKLKRVLAGFEGVYDLDTDYEPGKRELQLRLRESARPTGIAVSDLGVHVRSAMYGREARRITRNREDVRIMVRYPEDFRRHLYQLEAMWIPTPGPVGARGWLPLGDVAELTEAESFTTIHRSQRERSVTVFGDVDEDVVAASEVLDRVRSEFDRTIQPVHPNVRIEFLGSYEEQMKAFSSLNVAFPVALVLIYMLLAGMFRSYSQPIVVMLAIPFGVQGAIIGHWLTGNPFTILSRIGLVALTGIVVNDSLILVDFINQRVRAGLSHFEASISGAKLRLRAILLTTLTTVAGLTPLMFETSFQARFLIPMAVTLTFGLMFATALTLVLVPSLNLMFFDVQTAVRRMWRGTGSQPLEPLQSLSAPHPAESAGAPR